MNSISDKFLSAHRSQIKSSFWGNVNVFNTLILFNSLDLVFLGYHWFLHYMVYKRFGCNSFLYEMIANTLITVASFISLIPSSITFLVAMALYLVRFWHVCHMAGKSLGLIAFHMVRLLFGGGHDLWFNYTKIFDMVPSIIPTGVTRLVLILISVWYCLVLQRIRFIGGNGREFKSAEELEAEAFSVTNNGSNGSSNQGNVV